MDFPLLRYFKAISAGWSALRKVSEMRGGQESISWNSWTRDHSVPAGKSGFLKHLSMRRAGKRTWNATQRGSAVNAALAWPRVVPCGHLLWVTLGGHDLHYCWWKALHGQSPAPWDRFIPSSSSSGNLIPIMKTPGFWKEGIFLFW